MTAKRTCLASLAIALLFAESLVWVDIHTRLGTFAFLNMWIAFAAAFVAGMIWSEQ